MQLFCKSSPKIQPEAQAVRKNVCSTYIATSCHSHASLTRTGQGICFSEQPSKPNTSPLHTERFTYNYYTECIPHSPLPSTQTAFVKPADKLLARPQDQLCILILPEAPVTPRCLLRCVFLCFPWSCPTSLLWASLSAPLAMFLCGGQ